MIEILTEDDTESILKLYFKLVKNNNIYGLNDLGDLDLDTFRDKFEDSLRYTLSTGESYGIKEDSEVRAFMLCINYRVIDRERIEKVFSFSGKHIDYLQNVDSILSNFTHAPILYAVALCVDDNYRRKGFATDLVRNTIEKHNHSHIATDVTNPVIVKILEKQGFSKLKLSRKRYLMLH